MRLCVFIGDMYRDFALSIMKNLDYYATEKGHVIDVFGTCSIPTTNPLHVVGFKSILDLPEIHNYDGIILCYDTLIHEGMAKDLVENLLTDTEAPPVVCIRARIEGFYNVIPDNRSLMYDIAKHVISKCKTGDIGFVTGMDDLIDSAERREGFEKVMKEFGYEVDENKIFHGNYWITQGPEMADFFIKEDGTLPEAIICSNDYEAIALCNELIQRGYEIPKDTLISGVDNALEAREHIPSITTIEISNKGLVDTAMNILEEIKNGGEPEYDTIIPGTIIPRETTGDAVERKNIYKTMTDLNVASSVSMDDLREFVVMDDLFEGALSQEEAILIALDQFKTVKSVKSCYFCRYRENDRSLVGYFKNRGESQVGNRSFPNEKLLPDDLEGDDGMLIFFALSNKNEVYGYAAVSFDTSIHMFIDFKIEYLLAKVGYTINKLDLYEKLFGISDVMRLYILDPLTGTFNRRGFEKNISEKFDEDGRKKCDLAIASIDMDDLKLINDTYGHNAGDEAIKEIAGCLEGALKEGEFVARMGGDEFAAVLITTEVGRVAKFKRTVMNSIDKINKSGKNQYKLGASIGTADLTDWHRVVDCMNKADKAMYLEKKAKKVGR